MERAIASASEPTAPDSQSRAPARAAPRPRRTHRSNGTLQSAPPSLLGGNATRCTGAIYTSRHAVPLPSPAATRASFLLVSHTHTPRLTLGQANRRAQKVGNGATGYCRPPLRHAALPHGDALPRAVARAGRQHPAQVAQRDAGPRGGRGHAHRLPRPARRRRVRAAHCYPVCPRPQVFPGHPRADHRSNHAGAGQGPGYSGADHHSSHTSTGQGPGHPRADRHSHHAGTGEGPGHPRSDHHSHHTGTGQRPGHPRTDNHSHHTGTGEGPGSTRADHHPGRTSASRQGSCHPCSSGRAAHHSSSHHRAGQGPSHPCACCRTAHHSSCHSRPRHCPRRGSAHSRTEAQGQGARGRTTRQGNRPRSSSAPSHRRGTRGRRANARPGGTCRRAGPADQGHRRPRAGARQEEALVQEEDEGAHARPGRRGPRQGQGRGAHHRRGRRGSRAQRRLHRRRHRECPGEEHRDDGGRDRGGARRGGDARLDR